MRLLACVTHALNCVKQPDPQQIKPDDIGQDLAPALVEEITRFLDAQVAKTSG